MGYRLSKIYTKTGDKGETGLADGRRVGKDHPRVEAMGELDTLNSQIGLLLAELAEQQAAWPGLTEIIEVLAPCQHRLFDLGGELAMPDYQALQEAEGLGDQPAHGIRQGEIRIDLRQEQAEGETSKAVAHGDQAEARCAEIKLTTHARARSTSVVAALRAVSTAAMPR